VVVRTVTIDPYRRAARTYDFLVEPFNSALRQIGMKLYPPKAGMRVLDVGCGTGTTLQLYHDAGCQVFGIDLSPAMLHQANEKLGERATLVLGSAAEMDFPNGFFDLAIAMLTLHEMSPNIRLAVIKEMARVVKREGRMLLIDYHQGAIGFPKGWVYKAVIYLFEIAAGIEHYRNFRHFYANNGVTGLAYSAKLTVESRKIVGGGNLGLYLIDSGHG
jgi:ubiquinone/menaquinone biosynthesis C-methylase UbiE